jgi:hypothetical protein
MPSAGQKLMGARPLVQDGAMYGLAGITATDFYQTAAGAIPVFPAAGGGWTQLLKITSRTVSATRVNSGTYGSSGGFNAYSVGTWDTLNFALQADTTGFSSSASYTVQAGDTNKWYHLCGRHTGPGGKIDLFVNGVKIGTSPTAGIPTPPSPPTPYQMGRRPADGLPATDCVIAGDALFIGVPTDAEILANYNACKAAGRIIPMASVVAGASATNAWDFKTSKAAGNTLPATLPDLVGAAPMTRVGAGGSLSVDAAPVWV